MFKQIILPLLAVMAFIVILGLYTQGKIGLPSNLSPNQKSITINNLKINVEVAKTNEQKQKGLGGRKSLAQNSGMIFVFNKERPSFWMKDTLIPLDLIWISDGKIIKIDKNVATEIGKTDPELTRYPAPTAIDYVLEVNAGFCDRNSIKNGDPVILNNI